MNLNQLIDLFQKAKSDSGLAVIEGVQALKHAVRFKAEIIHIATSNIDELKFLIEELAPDVYDSVMSTVTNVDEATFVKLSQKNHRTKVVALARRRLYTPADISTEKPILFLEDPKDLENIGAVIRVGAAADVGAVISSGEADIWHPAVLRGGAGLHFALPVFNGPLKAWSAGRKLIALDPTGEDIRTSTIPNNAMLIFGTERYGIKKETLNMADKIVRLPMKEGVSSLNLATSVAATVYRGM
jgi:TrmH family RNA methyltransferase